MSNEQTSKAVTESEFHAMFYINKAVEFLVHGDIDLAFRYALESLSISSKNIEAINMLGVLHARLGFFEESEKLYLYGLNIGNDDEIILKNYYPLLKKLGRLDDANSVFNKLEKFKDNRPFKWMKLADDAYVEKNYKQALMYYKKAARMADYLHQAHAGIARSKFYLGDAKGASASMLSALSNVHDGKTTIKYQSKFDYFNALSKQ